VCSYLPFFEHVGYVIFDFKKIMKLRKALESIIDFGDRQLNRQNMSRTVVLPKTALKNCGFDLDEDDVKVNVSLVERDDEKFIKISPIAETEDDDDGDDDEDEDEDDDDE